jgi:tetratricopeptide (TPR) repeat protein
LGLVPNDLVSSDRLIEIARDAVAGNPTHIWRRRSLGLAHYRAGHYREALDQLSAPALADDSVAPSIQALAHWRLGEKREAQNALALADAKFESWCRERSTGQGTAWVTWWLDGFPLVVLRREAHELINGHAPDDRTALAEVRAAMGSLIDDRDSSTWAYDLALKLDPGNVQYRNALAARLIELGRIADAEPQLAAMVEGKAKESRAWVDRGMLLARAGQPDRAAADFARALELVPEGFVVWGSRTSLCAELAREPAAFDRLLALRPSDALLWYVHASEALTRGDWQAAIADFVRGGEPPASTEFAFAYAAALLLAGDEEAYGRYVSRQADLYGKTTQPFTLYVLARMAMLAHDPPVPPEQIVSWSNRTLTQEPRYAWYFHAKAMAAFRAGDIETTRRAVEESERRPWDAGVFNDVVQSLIELRQGHAVEARKRFERAVLTLDRPPAIRPTSGQIQLLNWLEFLVLRPQIEGPLRDHEFPNDPFAR